MANGRSEGVHAHLCPQQATRNWLESTARFLKLFILLEVDSDRYKCLKKQQKLFSLAVPLKKKNVLPINRVEEHAKAWPVFRLLPFCLMIIDRFDVGVRME